MAKLTITINDSLDQEFRKAISERMGYKSGNLRTAVEEAFKLWISGTAIKETERIKSPNINKLPRPTIEITKEPPKEEAKPKDECEPLSNSQIDIIVDCFKDQELDQVKADIEKMSYSGNDKRKILSEYTKKYSKK